MAKRLISLKQIREEKIARSRSWIFSQMRDSNDPFPLPVVSTGGLNLWSEDDVNAWVARFTERAKKQAEEGRERKAERLANTRCRIRPRVEAARS